MLNSDLCSLQFVVFPPEISYKKPGSGCSSHCGTSRNLVMNEDSVIGDGSVAIIPMLLTTKFEYF